jgi:hypothetical protein
VPLINPDDAGTAAADMVQNRFRNLETDTEALEAGGESAP